MKRAQAGAAGKGYQGGGPVGRASPAGSRIGIVLEAQNARRDSPPSESRSAAFCFADAASAQSARAAAFHPLLSPPRET